MQFVLTGFTPDTGFRVFNFEGIAEDRSRIGFTVRTDLALTRKYGIQMQDLPLLCRGLLERRDENETGRALIFYGSGNAPARRPLRSGEGCRPEEESRAPPSHQQRGNRLADAWSGRRAAFQSADAPGSQKQFGITIAPLTGGIGK